MGPWKFHFSTKEDDYYANVIPRTIPLLFKCYLPPVSQVRRGGIVRYPDDLVDTLFQCFKHTQVCHPSSGTATKRYSDFDASNQMDESFEPISVTS